MKKILLLFVAVAAVAFMGCDKEEGHTNGFTSDVSKVLSTLNGKFVYESWMGELLVSKNIITFIPFTSPKEITRSLHGTTTTDHRNIHTSYHYGAYSSQTDASYKGFPSKKQIRTNAIVDDTHYNALVGEIYEYEIIDENTIKLHDTDLSDWQWHTYKKES